MPHGYWQLLTYNITVNWLIHLIIYFEIIFSRSKIIVLLTTELIRLDMKHMQSAITSIKKDNWMLQKFRLRIQYLSNYYELESEFKTRFLLDQNKLQYHFDKRSFCNAIASSRPTTPTQHQSCLFRDEQIRWEAIECT